MEGEVEAGAKRVTKEFEEGIQRSDPGSNISKKKGKKRDG